MRVETKQRTVSRRWLTHAACRLVPLMTSACAVAVSFDEYKPDTWTVHGAVSGLGNSRLVLEMNGQLFDVGDGPFTSFRLADGRPYSMRIPSQPLGRQCSIAGGDGVVSGADVEGVEVRCLTSYRVAGAIAGSGDGYVTLDITQRAESGSVMTQPLLLREGPFSFRVADGTHFSVQVTRAPLGHACTVTHGEATIAGRDVDDVAVSCAAGGTELAALAVRLCSPESADAGGPCDGGLLPLVPAFGTATRAYTLTAQANCGRTQLCASVAAMALYPATEVRVQGQPVIDGGASIFVNGLHPTTRSIDVDVTGPDGETHGHYVVDVTVLRTE